MAWPHASSNGVVMRRIAFAFGLMLVLTALARGQDHAFVDVSAGYSHFYFNGSPPELINHDGAYVDLDLAAKLRHSPVQIGLGVSASGYYRDEHDNFSDPYGGFYH